MEEKRNKVSSLGTRWHNSMTPEQVDASNAKSQQSSFEEGLGILDRGHKKAVAVIDQTDFAHSDEVDYEARGLAAEYLNRSLGLAEILLAGSEQDINGNPTYYRAVALALNGLDTRKDAEGSQA